MKPSKGKEKDSVCERGNEREGGVKGQRERAGESERERERKKERVREGKKECGEVKTHRQMNTR